MPTSKTQIDAINKCQKETTKTICLRLHKTYDADIINALDCVPSKIGYIKELIRQDINRPE